MLAEMSAAVQPGYGAFRYPTLGQHVELAVSHRRTISAFTVSLREGGCPGSALTSPIVLRSAGMRLVRSVHRTLPLKFWEETLTSLSVSRRTAPNPSARLSVVIMGRPAAYGSMLLHLPTG
jgi:hypothetical protein